jgi:hypothetical protein
MPNYWLGIMAVVLAITLAVWIGLVFRADKQQSGRPREPVQNKEVIGGAFAARKGGRQVMPDPEEPIVHDDWVEPEVAASVPDQAAREPEPARPDATRQAVQPTVPGQRAEPVPEQTPAPGDRR